jgi:hypothetical protein
VNDDNCRTEPDGGRPEDQLFIEYRTTVATWRRRVCAVTVAILAAAVLSVVATASPARADPGQVCRVTFIVITGGDGIDNESSEIVSLAGQRFVFEDSDGNGQPDEQPFHRGGTDDRRHTTYTWNAHLPNCAPSSDLAQGFTFEHLSEKDDLFADNWDLASLKIVDQDPGFAGFVLYQLDATEGRIHRFRKNEDQSWNTNESRPDPPLDTNTNDVCRLLFVIGTGDDGIRNDSIETITVAGRKVRFEDSNGDGEPDQQDFHSGGTDDRADATFEWAANLSPCLSHADLIQGFVIEHSAEQGPFGGDQQDDWTLAGLRVVDRDTNAVYFSLRPGGGRILHGFDDDSQRWNSNEAWPTSDTDTDSDGLNDDWEIHGLDADRDGHVDANLRALGADARRRDVFVEIHCLVDDGNQNGSLNDPGDLSYCPRQDAMTDVVAAFANAPVPNPDGTSGIQLHLDTGDLYGPTLFTVTGAGPSPVTGTIGPMGGVRLRVPLAGNQILDANAAPGAPGSRFAAVKAETFDANHRGLVFHYAIFGQQTQPTPDRPQCISGRTEGAPANDFMVTLGGRRDLSRPPDGIPDTTCFGDTPANGINEDNDRNPDGSPRADEDRVDGIDNDRDCVPGTDTNRDGVSCGPRDIGVDEDGGFSVGTRAEQAGTFMHELGHNLGLDHGGGDGTNNKLNYLSVMNYAFQDCTVPTPGPGAAFPGPGGCDYSRGAVDLDETDLDECVGNPATGVRPINWDGGGLSGRTCTPPGPNVGADINGDGARTLLKGFDDWSNLFYKFRVLPNFGSDGTFDPQIVEADAAQLDAARRQYAPFARPAVVADITIDASQLSSSSFSITGVGGTVNSRQPQLYRLVPGTYRFTIPATAGSFSFTVTPTGAIDFDPALTFLDGRGTTRLTVRGVAVNIDATQLSSSSFYVMGVTGPTDARQVQTVRVIPGPYRFTVTNTAAGATFTVTPAGTIDFDPALTFLDGRGTTTLTVRQGIMAQ